MRTGAKMKGILGIAIVLLILIITIDAKPNMQLSNSTYTRSARTATATCPKCEGCELVRLEEIPDLTHFQFPATTEIPDSDTGERMQRTFLKYASLAVGISHLVPPPLGPYFRAGQGIFTSVLALATKGSNQLGWEGIERRVEATIEQYLTYDHFKDLIPYWLNLHYITAKCPGDLTRDDLKDIVKMKGSMFPQNNYEVTFTPNWVSTLNGYMMNMIAVYLELTRQNHLPQCALAEEMTEMRVDIMGALKSLHIKRYKALRGHALNSRSKGWRGHNYAVLQYRDEILGTLYPKRLEPSCWIVVQETKKDIFNVIRDDTKKIIDPLRVRFNELLNALSDALEGCDPIDDIPEEASSLDFPSDCFGTAESGESKCLLPCELYGYKSYWCPNDQALMYKGGNSVGIINSGSLNSAPCTRTDWSTCYPIKVAKRAKFFDASWMHGAQKKTKKNKKNKKAKKVKGDN